MTLRWITATIGLFLVCLFGLAAFVLQENLVLYFLNPMTPYETYDPPRQPDYERAGSWAHLPDARGEDDYDTPAVFYIHSTTYRGNEEWNAPIEDSSARTLTLKTAMPNEAGPFMPVGDVYAPFYRQATLFAFFTQKHQGRESRKTAYGDVSRAFDNFLTRIGPGRPIILVGYGQGGLHVQRLLMEYFQDDDALRRRLAVAYIIDQATPMDMFNFSLANIPPCEGPEDIRCVASWTAYSTVFEKEMWRTRNRQLVWEADGDLRAAEERPLLCTNPLDWQNGTRVDSPEHEGAASATGMLFGDAPVLVEQAISVDCRDGIAVISRPSRAWLQRPRWFGRQWAPLSFNLFYEDLRVNAGTRLEHLAEIRATEAVKAPPMDSAVDVEDAPINRVPDLQ